MADAFERAEVASMRRPGPRRDQAVAEGERDEIRMRARETERRAQDAIAEAENRADRAEARAAEAERSLGQAEGAAAAAARSLAEESHRRTDAEARVDLHRVRSRS